MRNTNDLRTRLAGADPLEHEPGLSDADAARIRRAVLATPHEPETQRAFWPRALAVAGAVAIVIAGGLFVGDQRPPAGSRDEAVTAPAPAPDGERRQLQFATPGGTRVIWVFDSTFDLK